MSQAQNAIPAEELVFAGHGTHWLSTATFLIRPFSLSKTKSESPSGVMPPISMPPENMAEVAEPSWKPVRARIAASSVDLYCSLDPANVLTCIVAKSMYRRTLFPLSAIMSALPEGVTTMFDVIPCKKNRASVPVPS
jgi:hypothetical protein